MASRLLTRVTSDTRPHSEPQIEAEGGTEGSVCGELCGQGERFMTMWAVQAGHVREEQGDGRIGRGDA